MNENQRRCPWCWEWIERTATKCQHCEKDVHPLPEAPSTEPPPPDTGSEAMAPQVGQGPETGAEAPTVKSPDMDSPTGQALWWISAILIYGILLFGIAVAIPFPRAELAIVLLVVEIGAAYLINRKVWQRVRSWPTFRVRNLLIYLAGAAVALFVLGWVRRRFLG
jgi:hypothetical protein